MPRFLFFYVNPGKAMNNLLSFLLSAFIVSDCLAVQCKDEIGGSVGSWEILKFPQSTSYVYSASNNQSVYDLNSTSTGALAHTMQQLWSDSYTSYVMYNDEPPYATTYNFSAAHAKAVFFWDESTAVALLHSIPKFPVGPSESPEYIGLLHNAHEYAQHIVCISLTSADLQAILSTLSGMNPWVYEGILPTPTQLPSDQCKYTSFGNRILITKSSTNTVDMWADCISSYFSTNLKVISWVHGEASGPTCNQEQTLDITSVNYPFGILYSDYQNHAKWGIGNYPLVCFGDLNRVDTQKTRSGSVVCWKDIFLYTALSNIVETTDAC
jgi:hypothetical protein